VALNLGLSDVSLAPLGCKCKDGPAGFRPAQRSMLRFELCQSGDEQWTFDNTQQSLCSRLASPRQCHVVENLLLQEALCQALLLGVRQEGQSLVQHSHSVLVHGSPAQVASEGLPDHALLINGSILQDMLHDMCPEHVKTMCGHITKEPLLR